MVKEQAFDFVLYGLTAEIFRGETLIKKINDLAAITIRLTGEMVYLPGVHYNILKQLA